MALRVRLIEATGGGMYQVNGESHAHKWLSAQEDPEQRLAFLEWFSGLAKDPASLASAQTVISRTTVYTACVPGTSAMVDYYIVEQFRTVVIRSVSEVHMEGPDEERL